MDASVSRCILLKWILKGVFVRYSNDNKVSSGDNATHESRNAVCYGQFLSSFCIILSAFNQVKRIILCYFGYFKKSCNPKYLIYCLFVTKEKFDPTKHFKSVFTYLSSLSIILCVFCYSSRIHKPVFCQLVKTISD